MSPAIEAAVIYAIKAKPHRQEKETAMKMQLIVATAMILATGSALAEDKTYPKAKVDFNDFKGLVTKVEGHRAKRLIDLNTFLQMSKNPGVIVLDTRSTFRFKRIHVEGSIVEMKPVATPVP